MEEKMKKLQIKGGDDKEILFSKAIKAGKRIYYLDVKKNLKEDLFIAITESKKVQTKEGTPASFEKHKVFLYKEDFEKFMNGMEEVIEFIKHTQGKCDDFEGTECFEKAKEIEKIDVEMNMSM